MADDDLVGVLPFQPTGDQRLTATSTPEISTTTIAGRSGHRV